MASPKIRDLKLEPSEQQAWGGPSVMSEPPEYPYGLNIELDECSLQKMDVSKLPEVGDMVQIAGYARVTRVSVREGDDYDGDGDSDDGLQRCVGLQLTALGIAPGGPADEQDAAETLYNKE